MSPGSHRPVDVVVLGGGIAGVSCALFLARAGARVTVIEQEPLLCSHSSGRNAAIWMPDDDDETTPTMARRSAEVLDELTQEWRRTTGALVVASHQDALDAPERGARRCGLTTERLSPQQVGEIAAPLAGGQRPGLWLREAGVLDIHAMTEAVAREARSLGAVFRVASPASRIGATAGQVDGVMLSDGTRIGADIVIIASGAWAGAHGAGCGAPLPLQPLRRHLVQLQVPSQEVLRAPIVWSLGDEVYFRPESGGLLSSPCDETPVEPCLPATDPAQLELLASKLAALAPSLAGCTVRRAWACIRTFAPDREIVAGADPRVAGLFFCGGLGGRGMTIGLGAGELVADLVLGHSRPDSGRVSPARLL